jgi:hypothetical protein
MKKKRRLVTIAVDFTVDLDEDVETHEVTFEIPFEKMIPMKLDKGTKRVGKVVGYTTQENCE